MTLWPNNPPGCLNGGGQIRPEGDELPKELITRVEVIYNSVKYACDIM